MPWHASTLGTWGQIDGCPGPDFSDWEESSLVASFTDLLNSSWKLHTCGSEIPVVQARLLVLIFPSSDGMMGAGFASAPL